LCDQSGLQPVPGWLLGKYGSIAAHASSDDQNSVVRHVPGKLLRAV